MVRASLGTLVTAARANGDSYSATWRATQNRDRSILVYHDKAVMLRVWPDNRVDILGNIRRTRADRRGVAAILLSVGSHLSDIKEP